MPTTRARSGWPFTIIARKSLILYLVCQWPQHTEHTKNPKHLPHEASVTADLPEALIVALEQVAEEQQWTLAETLEQALRAFVREWNAGRMSRRTYGPPLYSRHKSGWMAFQVRSALRHIHMTDGEWLSMVIQAAFCWFCDLQRRAAQSGCPAVPIE